MQQRPLAGPFQNRSDPPTPRKFTKYGFPDTVITKGAQLPSPLKTKKALNSILILLLVTVPVLRGGQLHRLSPLQVVHVKQVQLLPGPPPGLLHPGPEGVPALLQGSRFKLSDHAHFLQLLFSEGR